MRTTRLSVNVNKIATLRNARGGNMPDLLQVVKDCELFGAEGITVHPRPDERHIRYHDVYAIKALINTELNIEGYPSDKFIDLVLDVQPAQVTLVPDKPTALTSNNGWDTVQNADFLTKIVEKCKEKGIRTSIFVNPDPIMVENAAKTGTDRVELYTAAYAENYLENPAEAIKNYKFAAEKAVEMGLGINGGHDLSLVNLHYFAQNIPQLLEVSIGHALICDALYLGLKETITRYIKELEL